MIRFHQNHKKEILLSQGNSNFFATFFVTIALTSKLSNLIDFTIEKIFYYVFLSNWFDWNVKQKIFLLINYSWKKIFFYNISGAIHSNNISEILIFFEFFRNMYPSHRRLTTSFLILDKSHFLTFTLNTFWWKHLLYCICLCIPWIFTFCDFSTFPKIDKKTQERCSCNTLFNETNWL